MSHPSARLPTALYRAEQVRELDRVAIQVLGIPGYTLMTRAGEAVYRALRTRWPEAGRITVVCGVGNNAGDGYVVARCARADGLDVGVVEVGDAGRLRGDAATAREDAQKDGVLARAYQGEARFAAEVLVDAVFGTGLDRPVTGEWRAAIDAMNESGCPALAVDIPSGLGADTGAVLGAAVRAEATVSFIGLKQGLFTAEGPAHCGEVLFHDLAVPGRVYESSLPSALLIDLDDGPAWLAPRHRSANKGRFGHVLVVGGAEGYGGAARMAGEAAARCGAGLVSVATHPLSLTGCVARPELMCRGIEAPEGLAPLIEKASVVAVGPGLGQSRWGSEMLAAVLATDLPLVVDADALNLLSRQPRCRDNWVLTPHPGEAARMLDRTPAAIQADRFEAAAQLRVRYGGVVVLKGAGSLVQGSDGQVGLCTRGNPGMATGGTGDILTGVIAALAAQGCDLDTAARLGVCLHARAGELAAADGERGTLATDLLPHLRRLVNP